MAATILHGSTNTTIFQSRGPNHSRRIPTIPGDRGDFCPRDPSTIPRVPSGDLLMGQVKILKRGEPLTPFFGNKGSESPGQNRGPDPGLASTSRLGPDPLIVQNHNHLRFSDPPLVYGAAEVYVKSPPPSSVPVPCFLQKAGTASCELRRLLGLERA